MSSSEFRRDCRLFVVRVHSLCHLVGDIVGAEILESMKRRVSSKIRIVICRQLTCRGCPDSSHTHLPTPPSSVEVTVELERVQLAVHALQTLLLIRILVILVID